MRNQAFKTSSQAVLLSAIAAAYPVAGQAAPAARVDFTTGNVTAIGANGQSRNLAKGAQIEQGETIATNNGRAQLRFTDGAYVSLQPQSEFRIDQYRFDGKQDGNEKSFFSLVKGGLRTITGLVGKTNKNNYQVTTSVATIGIRGTEYTIQYGQSVVGTVGEGEIEVCNGAGCLSVTNGESYYVQNQEMKPVLTNKRTDLPPPAPTAPPTNFAEGENVDQSGQPCSIDPASCEQPAATGNLLTGTLSPGNVAYVMEFGSIDAQETGATLDSSGRLVSFDRFGSPFAISNHVAGTGTQSGNDGIIAWGRALDSSGGESIHFAVGVVPGIDLNSTFGGKTGSYELIGATQLTSSSGATGSLTNASMSVDFGSTFSNVFVGVSANLNGTNVSVGATGNFSGSGSIFFAQGGNPGSSTYLNVAGFFAGANAERAGISYSIQDPGVNGNESFRGAAAFKQSGPFTTTPNNNF